MLDLMFFLTETIDNPRHVGSVLIFHDGIGRSEWEWSGPDPQLITQRRTEIDAITGEVVSQAAALGLPVPTSRLLLDLIHGIEDTYAARHAH